MSGKKKLLIILLALLPFLGDYLYWILPRRLDADLPETVYGSTKADLTYYDEWFIPWGIQVDDAMLSEILDGLRQTEVTRRPKFGTMLEPFFSLYLYYPDGYARMAVVENGDIILTPDMRSDRQFYYDGGEELYQYLKNFSS